MTLTLLNPEVAPCPPPALASPLKAVLTVPEAAEMLGVSIPTVYRHMRTGLIPNRKIGTRCIISRAALEAFIRGPLH